LWIGPRVNAAPSFMLSGHIQGASGKWPVYVALWHSAGFLEHPVGSLRLDAHAEMMYRFAVEPGRWAVSAFEDHNDDGVLDLGLLGPKEPSGFWRPFRSWRKPRFDDVAATIENDVLDADIRLR
jgi:hypothetical protein